MLISNTSSLGSRLVVMLCGAMLVLPCAIVDASDSSRSGVRLDVGGVGFSRNDVRIPGEGGTRFDLTDLLGSGANEVLRLELSWQINDRNTVRTSIAPLRVRGTGDLAQQTEFSGENFSASETDATYQFNAYKLTWRYALNRAGRWQWGLGLTGLIRDAEIALAQGELRASDDNVGFVPALHFSGDFLLSERWIASVDFDGLAGGPGRLIDLGVSLQYAPDNHWRIGGVLRVLEGGADTDAVFNFAQLNYALLNVSYRF